ncbi:carboxylesterase family protein [Streptomyces lateritius]|uniref:Carboxylic ester hydrolase n=1 Tax=Streptomyces lateritius TaxID=67313 RepID=A0ABW6YE15_9ACTN
MPRRRTVVAAAAAVATAVTVPGAAAAGTASSREAAISPEETTGVVTRVGGGLIRGERTGGLSVFRGVPYAAPPVGALRYRSPRPVTPWNGVRDATAFAPVSYQSYLPGSSEDSLYANVWTPDTGGSRPVVVYIHGGGWFLGAGSEPDFDGARPASHGDMVVVTFNYRLGALGWGLHEDLLDERTGGYSNWGLQDQVALLHWVRRNAAAFGGDPENITLVGTSAGGSSTWQLGLLPELRGTVRRIVPISVKHVWEPASSMSREDSHRVFELVARKLGTTVRGLRAVPADRLKETWEKIFSGSPTDREVTTWREYQGPVVDDRWMLGHDFELPTPDLPTLAIYGRTEGTFFTTGPGYPFPGPHPTDDESLRTAVRAVLHKGAVHVADTEVDAAVSAYRRAAAIDGLPQDPVSIWGAIWGDSLFRYQITRLAERQARERPGVPSYLMEFAHPVAPPLTGTPHEATSKFLFGTYGSAVNAPHYGDGPLERLVSDTFIDLIASFARGRAPSSPNAPAVPRFSPDRPSTLILGGERVARIGERSALRQLAYWDTAGWVPVPKPVAAPARHSAEAPAPTASRP